MRKDVEIRNVEMRAIGKDSEMILEGYALKFDIPATHKNENTSFTEVIRRGALDSTDMSDVPFKYNHKDNYLIIARTRNHSLNLTVDYIGLKIRANLADTQQNRDVYTSVKTGLLDKMSFAFKVSKGGDKWEFTENSTKREVFKIDKLYDVSVVDTPFYDSTSIYTRSFDLLDSEKRRLDSLNELELLKEKIKIRSI